MVTMLKRFTLGALFSVMAMGLAQAAETTFEDWRVTCDEAGTCFAQMAATGPRVVLGWHEQTNEIRVGVIITAKARAQQPVTLRLDNNTMVYLKVNGCSENYCEAMARAEDTPKIVSRMSTAQTGFVGFLELTQVDVAPGELPRESVSLQLAPLSFAGFAAALDKVVNQGHGNAAQSAAADEAAGATPEPLPQDPLQ